MQGQENYLGGGLKIKSESEACASISCRVKYYKIVLKVVKFCRETMKSTKLVLCKIVLARWARPGGSDESERANWVKIVLIAHVCSVYKRYNLPKSSPSPTRFSKFIYQSIHQTSLVICPSEFFVALSARLKVF